MDHARTPISGRSWPRYDSKSGSPLAHGLPGRTHCGVQTTKTTATTNTARPPHITVLSYWDIRNPSAEPSQQKVGRPISGRTSETGLRKGMSSMSPQQSWFEAYRRHTSPGRRDGGCCQLTRSGANPGGDRAISITCRRIRSSSSGSSMTAITFISAPHSGHTIG